MSLISFRNVQKAFGAKKVYTDLSLDVHAGESLTIIGGSGQGKSVMLKMLVGLLKPDSGRVIAFGQDVGQLDDNALQPIRKQIAMLFQGGALFDSMTVVAKNFCKSSSRRFRLMNSHSEGQSACL